MSSDKKKPKGKKKAAQKEEEYVVEAIVKKKIDGGVAKYWVKWEGWPHSSNTWEDVGNLTGCPEILAEFERKHSAENDSETSSISKAGSKKRPKLAMNREDNDDSSVYDSDVENESTTKLKSNSIDVDVLEECPKDRVPGELLGVVPINRIMTYLVKWKPSSKGRTDGPVEDDMNLVKGDVFKTAFPQVVIAFYEKHIIWARDERVKEEVIREGMLEFDKSKTKNPDASVFPRSTPQLKINKTVDPKDVSSSDEHEHDSDEASNSNMEVDPID